MQRLLILFCVFCNFFSLFIIRSFGISEGMPSFASGSMTEKMLSETMFELSIIFLVMLFLSMVVIKPSRKELRYLPSSYIDEKSRFYKIIKYLFWFFILYVLVYSVNWSFDQSNRGVGQFEVSNRPSFMHLIANEFYLPFMLYLFVIGFFRNQKSKLALAFFVFLLRGISDGGRDAVVLTALIVFLYITYYKKLNVRHYLLFGGIVILLMSFAAADRFNEDTSFIESTFVKIIQCNSGSHFIPLVKQSIKDGYELTPFTFSLHFFSIFVPSFVLNTVFGLLSYPRASFIFNNIWNEGNEDTGYGFMMLADFYWCFKYYGYILYILVYYLIIKYFSKHIYSSSPAKVVTAIMMTVYFCNQREDFGNFLKPVVYTFIFVMILEFFRKKSAKKVEVLK